MFGACYQLFFTIAILIAAVIGIFLPDKSYIALRRSSSWRIAYALSFLFSLIQMLLMAFKYKYESPPFYLSQGDEHMVILCEKVRQEGH